MIMILIAIIAILSGIYLGYTYIYPGRYKQSTFNSFDEFIQWIDQAQPNIIYISGKGGSGKSYLSSRISLELGYNYVNLDRDIVDRLHQEYSIGRDIFGVYRPGYTPEEHIDRFVELTRDLIRPHTIVEGTIRSTSLIDRVFRGYNYVFAYIRPASKEAYRESIVRRYRKDLEDNTQTLGFVWNMIQDTANPPGPNSDEFQHLSHCILDQEWFKIQELQDLYQNYRLKIVYNTY